MLDPAIFGPDSPCFGCAPDHPTGFQLKFERSGDEVRTRFVPSSRMQGPPGIMHGGLVMTLADELGAWAIIGLRGRFGFTAAIQARLVRPVRIEEEVLGSARIRVETSRTSHVEVELTQAGAVAFKGELTFVVLDEKGAEKLLGGPLPQAWKRFAKETPSG